MSTRIRTNKIIYYIEAEKLASQYTFYKLETSEKYIPGGAYILDAPSMEQKIKSIVFESGRSAYIMMESDDSSKSVLKKLIKEVEGGEIISLSECKVSDIPDYLKLQLLLNALSSYDSDILKFNNLTGHFYCFHPEWLKHGKDNKEDIIWKVPCLELKISKDFLLEMSVRTFTSERLKNKIAFKKRKFEEYPKYIFGKDNTLRRKLKEEKDSGFILRQIDGTKTEIRFLDIQNEKGFDKSKVGVFTKVIDAFNSKYKGIARIESGYFEASNSIDYKKKCSKENDEAIRNLLSGNGIHIVDKIGDWYSERFCNNVAEVLLKKYKLSASIGKRLKRQSLNICVIHNEEYYDGVQDPHDKDYSGYAVQHVTLEDFPDNEEFALSTVIHEVLIKRDLAEGRITLFNWENLGFKDPVSFGVEKKDGTLSRYFFMNVNPDGSFQIKEQEYNLFEMNEYMDCVSIFEDAKIKGENIKGLIRDANGKINVIKDTGLYTLPEAEILKELLALGDTKLRGKERREELLSSCLDIKTFEKDGKLYYLVGTIGDGMRNSIPRAANIRVIEGYDNAPLVFDKLLPTMNVTFVHNGQLTVLPFPFKYLREYIENK